MKKWFKKIGGVLSKKNDKSPASQELSKTLKQKSYEPVKVKKENSTVKKSAIDIKKVSVFQETEKKSLIEISEKTTPTKPHKDKATAEKFAEEKQVEKKERETSWFSKLGLNFRKTSDNIKQALISKKIETADLEKLEEALLGSDLGLEFTLAIIEELKNKKVEEESIKKTISKYLVTQLKEVNHSFSFKKSPSPQVILVFGVNGSGKTTTIAKLAKLAKQEGFKSKIVAADTFRAAAVEQLIEWGTRLGVEVISGKQNEDPASVVFKAHQNSIKDETELLIIDTAGRLHNKIELMEELKKIHRVIQKNDPSAPHEKILILDSTIGQNTYSQIEAFRDIIGISGVIMTKLDGSSKGGALIGITKKYKIPIYAIGLGEQLEDLIAFNPLEYVDTLLGTNFGEKNESLH